MSLDELDAQILRELSGLEAKRWTPRPSYSAIARRLGIDEETVRLRTKRLREREVVPYWRLLVNPSLLGCREARVEVTLTDDRGNEEIVSRLRRLPGVIAVIDFRGPEIAVMLYHPADASPQEVREVVERACGASSSTLWVQPERPTDVKMRALDWKILAQMQEDAWRDVKDVAEELRVSARTVQRHLAAMVDGKAAAWSRAANLKAVPGLVCHFVVAFSDDAAKREALPRLRTAWPQVSIFDAAGDGMALVGGLCANFHEADDVQAVLRNIAGVSSVRMRLPKEVVPVPEWLREAVERRAGWAA